MISLTDILILAAAGFTGGFFSGFLGIGGGIIFIPFLDYFLKKLGYGGEELVRYILANSLFIIIFTGAFTSWKQYQHGNFYLKPVLYTAFPGIITSLGVSILIRQADWYNSEYFGIFFVALLLLVAINMFVKDFSKQEDQLEAGGKSSLRKFLGIGAVTGIMSSLSGLGGGMIMIPCFLHWVKTDIKKSTSISAGVVPLLALPMAVFYMTVKPEVPGAPVFRLGYILFAYTLPIIAGVAYMAPLGVKVARKVKGKQIQIIFALVILVTITKMLINLFS